MRREKFRFLISCLVLAGAAAGCQWDSSVYEALVADDRVERCDGFCPLALGIASSDECKRYNGEWHEAKCKDETWAIIKDENNNAIVDKEACLKIEKARFSEGYCVIEQENCRRDGQSEWVDYAIHEIGKGRYIKKVEHGYMCGSYSAVVSETGELEPCSGIDIIRYRMAFENGLCLARNNCIGAAIKEETEFSIAKAMCSKCGTGQAICGEDDVCVTLATDMKNCGRCGVECKGTETCQNGECRESVITICTEEQKRCVCEKDDATGELTCESSTNSGKMTENEICLDVSADMTCGMLACEEYKGEEVCGIGLKCKNMKEEDASEDDYQCVCPDGTVKLGDKCVNKNDPATCGIDESLNFIECVADDKGNTKEGVVCNGTECICASPYFNCNNERNGSGCRNLFNDKDNCGACGNVCHEDEACIDGECKCDNGFVVCDGKCIDPSKNAEHCGAAGTCSEEFKEGGDNSNFKGFVCVEENSSGCIDGKCSCIKDYILINGLCINPSNDNSYCGATSENDKGVNCLDIEGGICESEKCICESGRYPVYSKDGVLEKCVDVTTNTEYCGTGTSAGQYMNCHEACDGSNETTCNKEYKGKENQPWSCIPTKKGADFIGQCKQQCPENTLTCKNSTGNLVCVDKPNVKYLDKDNNICACSTCDDDNDPTNGCTEFYVGDSVEHCTACNTPCSTPFNTCSLKTIGELDSYECTCGDGEEVVLIGEERYCLNKELAHVEQKENGEWGCSGLYINDNGDWSDGCETSVSDDQNRCGIHQQNCYASNVQNAVCIDGICNITLCAENFDDCNSMSEDGCETNLNTDVKNCRFCGNRCNLKCNYSSCENKCELGRCCIVGELDSDYGKDDVNCCEGTQMYKYNYSFLSGCWSHSHYGCFKTRQSGRCWSLVE